MPPPCSRLRNVVLSSLPLLSLELLLWRNVPVFFQMSFSPPPLVTFLIWPLIEIRIMLLPLQCASCLAWGIFLSCETEHCQFAGLCSLSVASLWLLIFWQKQNNVLFYRVISSCMLNNLMLIMQCNICLQIHVVENKGLFLHFLASTRDPDT